MAEDPVSQTCVSVSLTDLMSRAKRSDEMIQVYCAGKAL